MLSPWEIKAERPDGTLFASCVVDAHTEGEAIMLFNRAYHHDIKREKVTKLAITARKLPQRYL